MPTTTPAPTGNAVEESSPSEDAPFILVVEDLPTNARVVGLILRRLGYRHDLAANGLEAVERCRAHRYKVILMDLQMPVMDGLEASRRILAEASPGAAPSIIALTANVHATDREECRAAGMCDFLGKPARLDSLRAALDRCLVEAGSGRP